MATPRPSGPASPVRTSSGGAGTIVSALLFLAILAWLGGYADLAKLWELIGP